MRRPRGAPRARGRSPRPARALPSCRADPRQVHLCSPRDRGRHRAAPDRGGSRRPGADGFGGPGPPRQVPVPRQSRRSPGARRARDHRVPLRLPVGARRVPRSRPVLRAVGIPDHDPARAGVAALGRDRTRAVLGPAGPPPPPGADDHARARSGHHGVGDRAVEPRVGPRRRPRQPLLRRELAVHRREAGVLPAVRRAFRPSCTCGRSRSKSSSISCGPWWRTPPSAPRAARCACSPRCAWRGSSRRSHSWRSCTSPATRRARTTAPTPARMPS